MAKTPVKTPAAAKPETPPAVDAAALDKRAAALDAREKDLGQREASLKSAADLQSKNFAAREQDLRDREVAAAATEKALKALKAREDALKAAEAGAPTPQPAVPVAPAAPAETVDPIDVEGTVKIAARRDGFRRGGLTYSKAPVEHPASAFSLEQLRHLMAEPMLAVDLIGEDLKKFVLGE
ncbi:MAG: hypothetical protein GC202_14240 [Alphaproteobacteria bacterium]|nr:hypothetical protein [Alphaproteobacteria bacterium]